MGEVDVSVVTLQALFACLKFRSCCEIMGFHDDFMRISWYIISEGRWKPTTQLCSQLWSQLCSQLCTQLCSRLCTQLCSQLCSCARASQRSDWQRAPPFRDSQLCGQLCIQKCSQLCSQHATASDCH